MSTLSDIMVIRIYAKRFNRWETLERRGAVVILDSGKDERGRFIYVMVKDADLQKAINAVQQTGGAA